MIRFNLSQNERQVPETRYVHFYREVIGYETSKTKSVTKATSVGDDFLIFAVSTDRGCRRRSSKIKCRLAAFLNILCLKCPSQKQATCKGFQR